MAEKELGLSLHTRGNITAVSSEPSQCRSCAILAGAAAGGVGVLVGQPFDTLKVRMQISSHNHVHPASKLTGLKAIISMYSGIAPPMTTSGIVSSLNFGGFEFVRRWLHDDSRGKAPLYVHWMAGAGGALPVTLVTCPIVLVKVQQQSSPNQLGIVQCLRQLTSQGGFKGLYRGFGLHAVLESYGRGCYMLAYEAVKRLLDPLYAAGKRKDLELHTRMASGACAGVVGWLSIYPLDVLRSRINAQGLLPSGPRYAGVWDCALQTFREGGVRAFFKGLGFSMIRAAPVASVVLPTFDMTNKWLLELHENGKLDF